VVNGDTGNWTAAVHVDGPMDGNATFPTAQHLLDRMDVRRFMTDMVRVLEDEIRISNALLPPMKRCWR
jgi:hypothetical protein